MRRIVLAATILLFLVVFPGVYQNDEETISKIEQAVSYGVHLNIERQQKNSRYFGPQENHCYNVHVLNCSSSSSDVYENHCWNCGAAIDSRYCERCNSCGWYKCENCGACSQGCSDLHIKRVKPSWNLEKILSILILISFPFALCGIILFFCKMAEIKKKKEE